MKWFGREERGGGVSPAVRGLALGLVLLLGLAVALGSAGCASPGPPRAPSLHLPEPVSDLAARRVGDGVELRFTAPWRSTDKLPLHARVMDGVVCRELERQGCVAVAGFTGKTAIATAGSGGGRNVVTWSDRLPPQLTSGARRLLSYRVEFFNRNGRSAGRSEAVYSATGPAPAAVEGLRAEGSRLGVVLSWRPAAAGEGAVLLEREDLASKAAPGAAQAGATAAPPDRRFALAPKKGATANVVWLEANAAGDSAAGGAGEHAAQTLDVTAEPDVPYRYTAWRSLSVKLGDRTVELRSTPSAAVEPTLREVYPPPAPTGLSAAGFFTAAGETPGAGAGYAVDLIWQPVDEAGLVAGFGGYNIYRAKLEKGREDGLGNRTRLSQALVGLPAFRDSSADPANEYRYFVTAVDAKGNESAAATVVLEPSQRPAAQ